MKRALIVLSSLVICHSASAEKIELVVGKVVPEKAHAHFKRLDMMGSGSSTDIARPNRNHHINWTEFVSRDMNFVIAIEVEDNAGHDGGAPIITRIYFSNSGQRLTSKDDGRKNWLNADKVTVDTTDWHATITENKANKADIATPREPSD